MALGEDGQRKLLCPERRKRNGVETRAAQRCGVRSVLGRCTEGGCQCGYWGMGVGVGGQGRGSLTSTPLQGPSLLTFLMGGLESSPTWRPEVCALTSRWVRASSRALWGAQDQFGDHDYLAWGLAQGGQ